MEKSPGAMAVWALHQDPPSTTVSQYQRATGKGRGRNLEPGCQQKGAYLLRVWHHKGHEGIHRHHPRGDGGPKAFPQKWPKGDVLPLLDVSCYVWEDSKLRTHSGLQTHSKLLPALDLHGPLYWALANQISQGTKRRVFSMKTEVLGGPVLGNNERRQNNPESGRSLS